jgi:hypothetical protein
MYFDGLQHVREALALDRKNGVIGGQKCKDCRTIDLFFIPGEAAPAGYQFAPLRMIFTVKQDLRCKARLMFGDHVIDLSEAQVTAQWLR